MNRWRALVLAVLVALGLGIFYLRTHGPATVTVSEARRQTAAGCTAAVTAFRRHESGLWLTLSAHVERLLPDSIGRYDHQRFIVRCSGGQTVLVVNDVSVGERVPVRPGDWVGVKGQYIWDGLGGLIHFTHHSSGGSGPSGWILFAGHVYAAVVVRG